MYYKLVAIDSTEQLPQKSWTLSLPATIGRSPEHAVSINHESISRTHCRLSLNADGALSVRDLNSMNGTYVGDEKISRSVLIPGDVLRLGSISLRVEYDSETDHGEPPPKPLTFDVSKTVPLKLDRSEGKSGSRPGPLSPPKKWWQFW
jgi:pSer/pThr/pTyr-binding forkhead associated (FHA) protein